MRFRSYDNLRLFDVVARNLSFTSAAKELNLTKGAVSYQINRLENELGFRVFTRQHRSIALTEKGKRLWNVSRVAFQNLEREIAELQTKDQARITIGMSTYFASRWLSPRLMNFMADHPRIGLRLQPLIDLIDLRTQQIDMAIRWGKGGWTDMEVELLFLCPAKPTAGATIANRIHDTNIEVALPSLTLLHDREGSEAWVDWHKAAGVPYRSMRDDLVIPDPNVRVQAVIDGQGVALNDSLVAAELSAGQLFQISPIELNDYGYHLAYPPDALENPALKAFGEWIMTEAKSHEAKA
jgi:DNA-binding transcriptional LysR family regulator